MSRLAQAACRTRKRAFAVLIPKTGGCRFESCRACPSYPAQLWAILAISESLSLLFQICQASSSDRPATGARRPNA